MIASSPAATGLVPLSFTQQYFLDVVVDEGFEPTWQHVVVCFELPTELDPGRVEDVVRQIGARYPVLLTRLAYHDGEAVMEHVPEAPPPCEVMDLRGRSDAELDLALSRFADRPFDLAQGPLWRLAFARATGRTVLAIAAHHLVSDAASGWLIAKDCILALFDQPLDEPGPPFEAFAHEEREQFSGRQLDERIAYWTARLEGASPLLASEHRPGPHELTSMQALPIALAPEAGQALQAIARAKRLTPLPLLTATVCAAVTAATGAQDVLCGVVTDVRGPRFAGTVGPFTDLMLVRDRASAAADGDKHLTAVRNDVFSGWQQHVPVALLRRHLPHLSPGGDRNPCDVLLNFLPAPPAADWYRIMSICGDATPALHFPRSRIGSPSRRFHAPLFLFLFSLIERLDGWVFAHRRPQLSELNARVAQELSDAIARWEAPASDVSG
jgi:hypothetical protein